MYNTAKLPQPKQYPTLSMMTSKAADEVLGMI